MSDHFDSEIIHGKKTKTAPSAKPIHQTAM